MFKGQYWYIILGVELEHPGLLVRLDHVDVEGVALELLVEHCEVHDDSGLDLVNESQPLERNEPERIIKLLSTQFLCNNIVLSHTMWLQYLFMLNALLVRSYFVRITFLLRS